MQALSVVAGLVTSVLLAASLVSPNTVSNKNEYVNSELTDAHLCAYHSTEVSNNVGIEPVLQKLSGEHLTQKNIYLI